MVAGFPKRVMPAAPAPRVEFKPAPPPTVALDEIEYDEDGRRVIKAPVVPANTRPPPTVTPPPSPRMPPPPPPRPDGGMRVRPTRPVGWKPPLGPWKPRQRHPGETVALNPDDIPY